MDYKDKSIYHVTDSDLDGVVCRLVAETIIAPVSKHYIPLNTSDRKMGEFRMDLAKTADLIIFTDTVPTKEIYEMLIKREKTVFLYDHHITGKQDLGDLPNYFFDVSKCGSRIFFEELTKGKRVNRTLAQIVELTDTYDMWRTDSLLWEKAKDLSNVLFSYVNWKMIDIETDTQRYSEFLRVHHEKVRENKSFSFTYYEQINALKAREKEEEAYRKAKKSIQFRTDNSGNNYAYVEMPSKLSFVCNRLLLEFKTQIKYIVAHSTFRKGETKISIRCKEGFDTSPIAERWGGGGHKQASGVELQADVFTQFKEGKIHLI